MSGFNYERGLLHQLNAVNSILQVFDGASARLLANKTLVRLVNPKIDIDRSQVVNNLTSLQAKNKIDLKYQHNSNIFDISMETGTGKTYTYTKMMFELNKNLGISKFIIIVPTLSIKAGILNFLKSNAAWEHFKDEYECDIKTYVVESSKQKKNKKTYMPTSVKEFTEANITIGKRIHVLIINAGMINSDTMSKIFDMKLFDKFDNPFDAIATVQPITIIDEPHRFSKDNKTWQNIEKFRSQFIFRFGATFDKKYENLVFRLTAVDAFNNDLVKGVITYIEEFEEGQNTWVLLKGTDGNLARFELNEDGKKKEFSLAKGDSLSVINEDMKELKIENLNKLTVVLSNGLELKRGGKINPYSYSQSIQDKMMENAIKEHFVIEKALLTRDVKIKPLTLFFIDDIEGYRSGRDIAGSLKTKFEILAKAYIEKTLKTEPHAFYKKYLEKSLEDLSLIHGGYFSKDNSDKDEKIENEVKEILHDKETLLSLDNTRRFIFSKWTLREGWDNPNVFQICKLRGSGSTTSKLQEVGRGLRLPVNEFMARVKDEKFDLRYYVDFTERNFADVLVGEINENSETIFVQNPKKLTPDMIHEIISIYNITEDKLLEKLDNAEAIKRNNDFKENGYEIFKRMYPKILQEGLKKGKIRNGNKSERTATIRTGKYDELKSLWEAINQKVILEYKINTENDFKRILICYFEDNLSTFKPAGAVTKIQEVKFENSVAYYKEFDSLENSLYPIVTMGYKEFLVVLSMQIMVNINTLHNVFIELRSKLDINLYLNNQTIKIIKNGFNKYLLDNAIDKFTVGYSKISNVIHPTKFTDEEGSVLKSVNAGDLGLYDLNEKVADTYLFDELFFDEDLEKQNIVKNIKEVIVFTKIPKKSIRIPVAGGFTYSPDFAYILKDVQGNRTLNLIVETKNKEKRALYNDEKQKIKHAQIFFNNNANNIKVKFETQFKSDEIKSVLERVLNNLNS